MLPALPAWAQFKARDKDPFDLCVGLEKRLPATIAAVKTVLEPTEHRVRSIAGYCPGRACEIHSFKGKGYAMELLVEADSGLASPLRVEVHEPQWRLLTPLRSGMNVSEAEQFFAFKTPAASARISVEGVCSRIDIDYKQRLIRSMVLNCQGCL